MKAKVLTRFKDKYNQRVHEVDEVIEVSEERFKEINSTKHGKLIEGVVVGVDLSDGEDITVIDGEIIEKTEEKEIKIFPDFEKMTKPELIEYGVRANIELNMNMTKPEMIELLSK